VAADASDPAQAADAAAGAAVIYHCASPPYTRWPVLFPALTRSILGAAESSGAKLVFADNLYAYGPVDGPLREDLPASARGRKGRIRAEMAGQLLGAYRAGRARIVIGSLRLLRAAWHGLGRGRDAVRAHPGWKKATVDRQARPAAHLLLPA
jgi:hypothetical protein